MSQIEKTNSSYQDKAIGIASTKPGQVIGENDGVGKPVAVALNGRVPVNVTTSNGDIVPGDYITTSDIAGVGMKATEPGHVIGKALTGLSGTERGTIIVFVENTFYDGVSVSDYTGASIDPLSPSSSLNFPLDRFSFMVKRSLAKIDPKLISGSGFDMNGALESFSEKVLGFSGSLGGITSDILTLKSSIDSLSARIVLLE